MQSVLVYKSFKETSNMANISSKPNVKRKKKINNNGNKKESQLTPRINMMNKAFGKAMADPDSGISLGGIKGLSLDDLGQAMDTARKVKDIKKRREQEKNIVKMLSLDKPSKKKKKKNKKKKEGQ